jgi:DNA primase
MDTRLINSTTNLSALVPGLRKRGKYFTGPCPFCGGEDRFTIKRTEAGDLWICRRCGDGKYHDAVAFLMRRDRLSFAEVVGQGNTKYEIRNTKNESREASDEGRETGDEPPDEDWQIRALEALKDCCDYLHIGGSPDAAAVWRYLQKRRGLTAETVFWASLGYNPAWREVAPGRWLAPGITIPGMVDGHLWYVQVRTTEAARAAARKRGKPLAKYSALSGSRLKALYNADAILRVSCGRPANGQSPVDRFRQPATATEVLLARPSRQPVTVAVVEGEFDALLLSQIVPASWAVVTMGSAGSLPGPNWLPFLAVARRIWLRLDGDEAGAAGLARWRKLSPGIEPMQPLPDGEKDLTDFWAAGGDIHSWINSHL